MAQSVCGVRTSYFSTLHLRRLCVFNGQCVVLFRGAGLDLVAGLEGAFQLRGLVYVQTDFLSRHILDDVKLPIHFQHVTFDSLGTWYLSIRDERFGDG